MSQLPFLDPERIIPISRGSTEDFKTGAWSRLRAHFEEKLSPCRGACPTGNDIAGALSLGAEGDFDGALAIFLEESPLPGVCGRVCYHPCQGVCNRLENGGAVSIRALERAAADLGNAEPRTFSSAGTNYPVAVVGSGPAGLSAAYHLARLGHPVTLMEAESRLGGLLAKGIPPYRLPSDALEKDLSRILKLGITVKTGVRVDAGKLDMLKKEHRAVFLALGGWKPVDLGIADKTPEGVLNGLNYVQNQDLWPLAGESKVVVIGGGNTALDAARTALRHGAKQVTLVYRRDRDAMPAFDEDVSAAEEEGTKLLFLMAPTGFVHEKGRVTGVSFQRTRLRPHADGGRPVPVPVADSRLKIEADLVLLAAGQEVETSALLEGLQTERGRIRIDYLGRTSRPDIYAGGDMTPTRASVVDALASGKRAAVGIHLDLVGLDESALAGATLGEGPEISIRQFADALPDTDLSKLVTPNELCKLWYPDSKPAIAGRRKPGDRIMDMGETDLGLSPEEARTEAQRCYSCGVCVACGRCSLYCPDVSMSRDTEGRTYRCDADHCKGCGVCVAVCVRGVFTMSEEK